MEPLVLGIDLGTSSVKAVLLATDSGDVIKSCCKETHAQTTSNLCPEGSEQDVGKIVAALTECLTALSGELLQRVTSIGISGQMHGVVFWKINQGCKWTETGTGVVFQPDVVSSLVTWQDGRCSKEFLNSLPQPQSHLSVATGFGCATIYWYLKNRPNFLKQYNAASTIQDFVVAMLCGLQTPLMSVQNAASWGYFNTVTKSWNHDILRESGFPVSLLPDIGEPGEVAGRTLYQWCGIPKGAKVGLALGDFQCSVYSSMTENTDAGFEVPDSTIYAQMIKAASSYDNTKLTITPTIFGERHIPHLLASVSNISVSELSLGHVARSLCRGIVQNLHSMLPYERLKEAGITRIIGSGSALSRNEVLRQEVESVFPLPVVYGKDVDSAFGAALVMMHRRLSL
ncbi:sedoheptulokinase isoform X2 [Pleurodeles waltl]|uniref:sedoheptulokinase isoform X2 n=1 Tax=Pleurodeles waltl TaxID=8319 RepID=UPI00370961A7